MCKATQLKKMELHPLILYHLFSINQGDFTIVM